jgi:murein L,D-transpeptidase YcbB/YkuD
VGNALGRVKFMFPNRYNVYIHDTPSKTLFARSQRSFSHGCIRLSNPFDLAVLLLGEQGWDHGRFEGAVERGRTRTVSLDRPVPVHILYQTAWVAPDGSLQFREDIYGRDAALAQQLATTGS